MRLCASVLFVIALAGCSSTPPPPAVPAGHSLAFVDTNGFDRDFSRLAATDRPLVDLNFYSPVTPNQIPERLQKWLSAVEKHGGSVTIEQPPGEFTPRSPALVASILGSAWTGIKALSRLLDDRMYSSVQGRDAVLVLERSPTSKLVTVARVEFRRSKGSNER
jgi:hypothetical protein